MSEPYWEPLSASPVPLVTIGTTLPASPIDGQEAILVDSLTAPTYSWYFRYVASITDTYKWVFVGGAPWFGQSGSMVISTSTPTDIPSGPVFALPRTGIYRLDYGAQLYNSGNFAGGVYSDRLQPYLVGVAVGTMLDATYHGVVYDGGAFTMSSGPTLSVTGNMNLRAWMDRQNGQTTQLLQPWLRVTPLRVA